MWGNPTQNVNSTPLRNSRKQHRRWTWIESQPCHSIPRLRASDKLFQLSEPQLPPLKNKVREITSVKYTVASGRPWWFNKHEHLFLPKEIPRSAGEKRLGLQHPSKPFSLLLGEALLPARLWTGRRGLATLPLPVLSIQAHGQRQESLPCYQPLRLQAKATSPLSPDFLVHRMEKRSTSRHQWFLPVLHPLLLLITLASFLLGEHPSFSVNVDTRLGLDSQNRDIPFSWSRHLVQGWVHELS